MGFIISNIPNKYNRLLIIIFSIAPFMGFLTISFLDMDFNRIIQLFSYFGVFLILILRDNKSPINFPNYLFFYLLFICYVFYSDLYRLHRDFKVMYLFSNKLIGGFNMMFIIENIKIPRKYFNKIIIISKIILLIAIIVIIIQQVVNPTFFVNRGITAIGFATLEDHNKTRLVSIYSWLGGLMRVGFGFVPVFLLIIEYQKKKNKKVFIWLLAGLLFAFLSKARWIMVNTLLAFIILYIHSKVKIKYLLRYLILVPIFVIMTSILLENIGVNVVKIVNERILESDKRGLNNKSAGTRLLAVAAFNKLYWEHPFFGIGSIKYGMGGTGKQDYKLRSFLKGRSSQIHVGYLSLLYMYGIVGAYFFLSFLFFLLRRLYRHAKETDYWSPYMGFIGFFLANLTLVTFNVFEMGLILALFTDRFYQQDYDYKLKQIV